MNITKRIHITELYYHTSLQKSYGTQLQTKAKIDAKSLGFNGHAGPPQPQQDQLLNTHKDAWILIMIP